MARYAVRSVIILLAAGYLLVTITAPLLHHHAHLLSEPSTPVAAHQHHENHTHHAHPHKHTQPAHGHSHSHHHTPHGTPGHDDDCAACQILAMKTMSPAVVAVVATGKSFCHLGSPMVVIVEMPCHHFPPLADLPRRRDILI